MKDRKERKDTFDHLLELLEEHLLGDLCPRRARGSLRSWWSRRAGGSGLGENNTLKTKGHSVHNMVIEM